MREPIFLLALGMLFTTVIVVARSISAAVAGRGASPSEIADLREQLHQQTVALEDANSTLTSHTAQLAELQERVDFAERVLAQARERKALGPGDAST